MVSDIAMIGAVVVSAMGALFGLYQARKADQSATTTKTIEIGVKDLVDQYQEANKELREQNLQLREEVDKLRSEQRELEADMQALNRKVDHLETTVDNKNAQIIGLKRRLGEPLE